MGCGLKHGMGKPLFGFLENICAHPAACFCPEDVNFYWRPKAGLNFFPLASLELEKLKQKHAEVDLDVSQLQSGFSKALGNVDPELRNPGGTNRKL